MIREIWQVHWPVVLRKKYQAWVETCSHSYIMPFFRQLGVLRKKYRAWTETELAQRIFELGMSLLVGLTVGSLMVVSQGLSSKWQQLFVMSTIALACVLLINNLEKVVLAVIAISVPLNLDISLMVSPYAGTPENIARGNQALVALTELRVSVATVVIVIGYALWIIGSRSSDRKPARFFAGTTIPVLGLILMSILSVSQARDLQLSFFRIVQLCELFLAFFYLANHLQTIEDMRFFLVVSTGAMFAESVLMIVQWTTGLTFHVASIQAVIVGSNRIGGTIGHPGAVGSYLSAHLLITLAMMWGFSKVSHKISIAICLVAGFIALISTGLRAGWIGLGVTVPIFIAVGFWRGLVRRTELVLLFVAVLILGVAFYGSIYDRITGDDGGSAESRPMMFKLAWNIIRAHPWLGVGAGNYALVTRDYYTSDIGGDPATVVDIQVHNRYLLIWAESGLFAFLFYLAFLFFPVVQTARYVIRSHNRFISLLALGLGCAIISLAIQMLTGPFHKRPITYFVWLMSALVAGLRNLEQTFSQHEGTDASSTIDCPSDIEYVWADFSPCIAYDTEKAWLRNQGEAFVSPDSQRSMSPLRDCSRSALRLGEDDPPCKPWWQS